MEDGGLTPLTETTQEEPNADAGLPSLLEETEDE